MLFVARGPGSPPGRFPLAIFIVCFALGLASDPPAWGGIQDVPDGRFRRLTVSDGLGNGHVRGVLQDRRGFLWICTANGLDRYDGLEFRHFRHDPANPQSLGSGLPQKVVEDSRGRLWVGLFRGGISRFDPVTGLFTHFRHDPTRTDSLSHDDVTDILLDLHGALWAATGGGLNRLDPDTGRVRRFVHDPADPLSLSDDDVAALVQDRTGAMWVGTGRGGLDRLDPAEVGPARFQHFRHDARDPRSLSSDNVRSLLEDRAGRLWVGTWDAGLQRYEPEKGAFVRYGAAPGAPDGLESARIYGLLEDHAGALWLATWGSGLVRLDPATGAATRYGPDASDPESLAHANVSSLFEDRSGLLWIGTGGAGLNMLDLKGKAFRRYRAKGPAMSLWAAKDVRAVLQDRKGDLWLGTAGGGLLRLDRSGRVLEHRRNVPGHKGSLADDNVWALLEDREGTLWVGTFKGLDRLDRAQGRFVHHRHDPRDPRSLGDDTVYALHEDRGGDLWIGTWDGINRLDKRTGRFIRLGREDGRSKADAVVGIGEDGTGAIWFAARGGLARLDPKTGAREIVPLASHAEEGGGPPLVACFERDTAGTLWIGTGPGLTEVPPSGKGLPQLRHHPIDLRGGLIVSIEEGRDGALWLGTTSGLARYDPGRRAVRFYGAADGLPSESFGLGAAFRNASGELFFGTPEGLVSFRPEEIADDPVPPPVALTALLLGQRSGSAGGRTIPLGPASTEEIRLGHDEHVVTLEFAALSFRAPHKNRYRYQLEGFDGAASELPGDRRGITYTNLPPGRYVFRVTAANSDGAWNPTGASLAIRVMPPWWGTWWFRLFAVLGGVSLLLGAHRLRVRRIQARNERLELEVGERRQAEEALVRSERQLRLIADSLPVLIAYVDAGNRCVFLNAASERWFRRPRAELEGRSLDEIVPADIRASLLEPVARAIAGQGSHFEIDVRLGDKNRRVSFTVVPHTDQDGTYLGLYVLAQDITPRARAEEMLRRQQEQLAHASRVLTLGELAAALAHELNQPLTAILSNAQATLRIHAHEGRPSDDVDEALQDIAADATRAGEIIRRLRELVRRGESKREPLDLNGAIRGIEPLLRAGTLEHDVALDLHLAPDLPETQGDVIQLQQVMLNLVRNGTEAMLAVPKGARHLHIRTARNTHSLVVEVTDTGPSVGDGDLARLFVPFETTKPGGLGMGLSISRSIVEAHGGRIAAERNPGGGLCVRFTVPVTRR